MPIISGNQHHSRETSHGVWCVLDRASLW